MKVQGTMGKDSLTSESQKSQTTEEKDQYQKTIEENQETAGQIEQQASDTIFSTKNRVRENLLKQFRLIKEIVKNEIAETDELKAKQKLKEIALDVNQLYPPSSQQDIKFQGKGSKEAKSFLQFQQLVQKEIELAFEQSGIAQKVQHLEKQNMYLYQIALEAPTMKQLDEAIGGDGEGSGYNIIHSPDFQQKYENLKINIMKRVKQNMKTQKQESTMKGSQAKDDRYQFALQSLVTENQLFDGIQDQLMDAMVKQKTTLEKAYTKKFDKINAINFELRKSCLMEIHMLRETYFLQNSGQINDKEASLHARTQMFSFDHGLDDQICELIEVKLKQVSVEYLNTIKRQEDVIEMQRLKLMKYKLLTPKTFGLVDLTLKEIFDALALIERDARKVWRNLISSYPTDYFVGVIEDTYGAFFDKESQARLTSEVKIITDSLLADVQAMGNEFKAEKRAIFQQVRDQELLYEEVKLSYQKQLDKHKASTEELISKRVDEETRKMTKEFQMEKNIFVEAARRNKEKYQKIKLKHNDNEGKLAFFKWKVVTKAFKKTEGLESQFREKELRKLLSNEGAQKLKNSLQARGEKMEMYKKMFDDSKRELADLKNRHNQIIHENVDYSNQLSMIREELDQVFRQTNEVTIPSLREKEIELKVAKQQLQAALTLTKRLQEQNVMIEEKYNIREKGVNSEKRNPKERVILDMLNQVMASTAAGKVLLQQKLERCVKAEVSDTLEKTVKVDNTAALGDHSALDGDLEARLAKDGLRPIKLDDIIRQKPSRNFGSQTDIQNIHILIKQTNRIDQFGRRPYNKDEPKFEQECQTDIDFELFEDLEDSYNLYQQQKKINEDLQLQMLDVAPTDTPMVEISQSNTSPGSRKRTQSLLIPNKQNSLRDKVNLGIKNQMSLALKKGKKLETPSSKKSPLKNKVAPIYENEEDLLGKSSILNSQFGDNKASKDSCPTPQITKACLDPRYQTFLEIEKLSQTQRFDRIKFMYETNIDLIEMVKENDPNLYMQCVKDLKQQVIESYDPANDVLFNKDKDWLMRLYPQNQPEVFLRLQNLVNDKEVRKQRALSMKQEQRYFSMSLTKNQNLSNLQTSLKKAFRSKSKREQRIAQMQIKKQLHNMTKIDKFDSGPCQSNTADLVRDVKGNVNINVVHTSIVNMNDQTSFQGVKVSHPMQFGSPQGRSSSRYVEQQSNQMRQAQQQNNQFQTQQQQSPPQPRKNIDLVVNPNTHVILTPTIELERDSQIVQSKTPNKSQLGSKSPTASNDISPMNALVTGRQFMHPLQKLVFADDDQKSVATIEMIDKKDEKELSKALQNERIDTQEFMNELKANNEQLAAVQQKLNLAHQDFTKTTLKSFKSETYENPPLVEIQNGAVMLEATMNSKQQKERNVVISKQGTPFEAQGLDAWPYEEEATPMPYQMHMHQRPIIHVPSANIKSPLGPRTTKNKPKGVFQFNEIQMSPDNFQSESRKQMFSDYNLLQSPVNQSAVFNYPSPKQNLQQSQGKQRIRPFTGTKRRTNIQQNAINAADSSSKTSFNVKGQQVNNCSTNLGSLDFAYGQQAGQNLRMTKFLGNVEGHPKLQYGLSNQPFGNMQGYSSRVVTESPFMNDYTVPQSSQFGNRGIGQNIHTFSHDVIHEFPQRNQTGDLLQNQFSEIKISTTNYNPMNYNPVTEQSQMNMDDVNRQSLALIQYSQAQIQNQQNYLNTQRDTKLLPDTLEKKTQRFNEPLNSSTNYSQGHSTLKKGLSDKSVKSRIQSASIRQSRLPNASIHFRDKQQQRIFQPRGGGNSTQRQVGNFLSNRKTEQDIRWAGDQPLQTFQTSRPIQSPDSQAESKAEKYTIKQNSSQASRSMSKVKGGGFNTRGSKKKGKAAKTQAGALKSIEPNNDDLNITHHMQPNFPLQLNSDDLSQFVDHNGYRLSQSPAKSAIISPHLTTSPALPIEVKIPNLENYIQEIQDQI